MLEPAFLIEFVGESCRLPLFVLNIASLSAFRRITRVKTGLIGQGARATPEAACGTERSEYRTGEDVGAAYP
jgi:hypothetical protein